MTYHYSISIGHYGISTGCGRRVSQLIQVKCNASQVRHMRNHSGHITHCSIVTWGIEAFIRTQVSSKTDYTCIQTIASTPHGKDML